MKAILRSSDGSYSLRKRTTIGRDKCDILLQSATVERQHAIIELREGPSGVLEAVLSDLNTAAGSYVNDCRVQNAAVRLAHGDIIRFGHAGRVFHFELVMAEGGTEEDYSSAVHSHLSSSSNVQVRHLPFGTSSPVSVNNTSSLPHLTLSTDSPARPLTAPSSLLTHASTRSPATKHDSLSNLHGNIHVGLKANELRERDQRLQRMGDELSRLASFESECHRKDCVIADLREQVSQLQSQGQIANQLSEQLRQQLLVSQAQEEKKEQQLQEMHQHVEQMKALRKDLSQRRQAISALTEERSKLRHQLDEGEQLVERLRKDSSDKASTLTMLRGELTQLRVKKEKAFAQELDQLKSTNSTQEQLLRERAHAIVSLQQQVDAANHKLVQLRLVQDAHEKTRNDCHDATEHAQRLQQELDTLSSRFAAFVNQVARECELEEISDERQTADQCSRVVDRLAEMVSENQQLAEDLEKNTRQLQLAEEVSAAYSAMCAVVTMPLSEDDDELTQQARTLADASQPHACTQLKERLHLAMTMLSSQRRSSKLFHQQVISALRAEATNSSRDEENALLLIGDLKRCLQDVKGERDKLLIQLEGAREEHKQSLSSVTSALHQEADERTRAAVSEAQQLAAEEQQEAISKALRTEQGHCDQLQERISELEKLVKDKESRLGEHEQAISEQEQAMAKMKSGMESLQSKLSAQPELLAAARDEVAAQCKREIDLYKEQSHQHALTIVTLENKLLSAMTQGNTLQQHTATTPSRTNGSHVPDVPGTPPSVHSKTMISSPGQSNTLLENGLPAINGSILDSSQSGQQLESSSPDSPNFKQLRPWTTEYSLQADVNRLERLVTGLRQELAETRRCLDEECDLSHSLRRDLAGATAQFSDVQADLNEQAKQELERLENELQYKQEELLKQAGELSALRDQCTAYQRSLAEQTGETQQMQRLLDASRGIEDMQRSELLEAQRSLQSEEMKFSTERAKMEKKHHSALLLAEVGARCRGEQHDRLLEEQRSALSALKAQLSSSINGQTSSLAHDQALREIASLKSQLSDLRASQVVRDSNHLATTGEMSRTLGTAEEQARLSETKLASERVALRDMLKALEGSEQSYCSLARGLSQSMNIDPVSGTRSMVGLIADDRQTVLRQRDQAAELFCSRVKALHERVERKEKLLQSYEDDLGKLRHFEMDSGAKSAKINSLEADVHSKGQELAMLRESVRRLQDDLDQQLRLNVSLRTRQVYRESQLKRPQPAPHTCHIMPDELHQQLSTQQQAFNQQLRKKNLEVRSLKNELASTDEKLQATVLRLTARSLQDT